MPLDERTNRLSAGSAVGQKRTLDEFLQKRGADGTTQVNHHTEISSDNKENIAVGRPSNPACSPILKSSPALTESGSSPDRRSPSPNPTPAESPSMTNLLQVEDVTDLPVDGNESSSMAPGIPSQSPPRKKRTSGKERARQKQDKEEAERIKAEAKAAKERQKDVAARAKEEAKAAKVRMKEEAARAKENAERAKAEAKAAKAREKEAAEMLKAKAKAAKAAAKAEQDAQREQKKAKQERQQRKLTSMFSGPVPGSKAKSNGGQGVNDNGDDDTLSSTDSGQAELLGLSVYSKMFQPFFVKENVSMASASSVPMDQQTAETKCKILEAYVEGTREKLVQVSDWVEILQIPGMGIRGRICPAVRDIIADAHGNGAGAPIIDLTTESQNAQIRQTCEALRKVPLKTLKFWEDVRPPYIGTVSSLPAGVAGLKKLARKPFARDILPLSYDYDSEAEWQEEEGEDVDSENDEDEFDEDETLDDLIDDSEGAALVRPMFSTDMEPQGTGLCWENHDRLGPVPSVYKYRMEFVNENLEHLHSIDPFSSAYWEKPSTRSGSGGESSTSVAAMAASAVPASGDIATTISSTGPMAPPPAPTDAPHVLTHQTGNAGISRLPRDKEDNLKALMRENLLLSKIGLVELFISRDKSLKKAHVKASVDALTEKPVKGTVEKGRKWVMKADV